jgi:hypothetical protein
MADASPGETFQEWIRTGFILLNLTLLREKMKYQIKNFKIHFFI